ncbi:MAG: Gfo/Idh/MocA family oxidoreductase [Phycisphaerae bacterium]|nr:Gfo/Idh/MocA family oxidoreductase [Phycisphaerae bacterium]
MIKVGILGCGFMGRTHYNIYAKNSKAKIVALMDLDKGRRQGKWADQIGNLPAAWPKQVPMKGVASYGSVDDAIADPNVDLIDITLPTSVHADVAIKALQAGKHVLSEKPMALTHKDCLRIVKAAAKSKGYYMCAQCIRFWPQYAKIKELVDSGKYGKAKSACLKRLAPTPGYSKGNWLLAAGLSGGAVLDLHVHDIDFANYLFGKPKRVVASGTKGVSGGIDHIEALYDYGKDLLVMVEGGWSFPPEYPFQMVVNVRCEKATFEYVLRAGEGGSGFGNEVVVYPQKGKLRKITCKASDGWTEEINYFLDCIAKKRKPTIVTAKTSADSIAVAEAEIKSVATGKPVAVK